MDFDDRCASPVPSPRLSGPCAQGLADSEDNKHAEAFANADFDEATGRLVALVRSERPQVIVAYGDDHSGYPHPDHIRAHEIAVAAFDAASNSERFPEAGAPWQPSKLYYMGWSMRSMRATHEALLAAGPESWYGDRLKDWKDEDHRFTAKVPLTLEQIIARSAALRAHATQVAEDSFWFALSDEERHAAYPYEDYILARGPC